MEDFHRGPYETAVGDAEMLIEVRFPVRPNGSSAYEKVERRAGDWAVVRPAPRVDGRRGRSPTPGSGLAAVGPEHHRLPSISEACAARRPPRSCTPRPARWPRACNPVTDMRGSAEYKRHLADELTRRALRTAVARIDAAN